MSPNDRKEGAEQQRGDATPSSVWEPGMCGGGADHSGASESGRAEPQPRRGLDPGR